MHYQHLDRAWAELTGPGGAFELIDAAIDGVPVRTFRHAPGTVRDLWVATAAFGPRDYLVYADERISYAEAHRRVAAVANWLKDQGVGRGDRVAIAMRNYPEWLLVYWACACLGAAVAGLNAWWSAAELAFGLEDSAPKVLFADEERLARLDASAGAAAMRIVAVRADAPKGAIPWSDVLRRGGGLPDAEVEPDDDVCIFYTSGTTGTPKGAQLTHRSCITNLMNMQFVAQAQTLAAERAGGQVAPRLEAPSTLVTTPLFHVTANNCAAYVATAAGGKLVLMYRWDPGEALALVERERITSLSGVPVMAREVLNHPRFAEYDTSSLLTLGGGGAPLLPDLVARIDQTLSAGRPNTGYGMTETSGIVATISGDFFVDKPTSCGRPVPSFDVRIVDEAGEDVRTGEPGELLVRGAGVVRGYLNRPEATAAAIVDGWLRTGDIARLDADGFLHLVDRKKDMVLRGGENVYCAEVEAALHTHPAVVECAVFGVPDERLGEEVGAAVWLGGGAAATAEELQAHCRERLARHKTPRYVWLLDEPLPRNANGKFLKRELRDKLAPTAARA